jgi:DNA polymerase III delta subunit
VHQPGVRRPLVAAERIVAHAGEDADALLTAIDMIRALAGDEPIEPEPIDELLSGSPERPFWEFSGAVLQGEVRKALSILHAGRGMDPEQALATLLGEIRRCLVCLECPDDAEAHRRLGRRGGSLFHARRTAQALGTASLQRLLTGCLLASRELRQGGTDRQLAIETLVLHARAVVGAGKR